MPGRVHRVITERIKRLGLSAHPGLLFMPGLEGYKAYAFGSRSGPVVQATNIFHEFAHAVEFGPEAFEERCSAHGYRFDVPEVWVYDRFCVEPRTMQAVSRELRTFGYQFHLLKLAGYRVSPEAFCADNAPVMRFMPDWWLVPGKGDEARIEYCKEQILRYIEQFSAETALRRLTGWLDCTERRLSMSVVKKSAKGKYDEPMLRYRADGSVYSEV